MSKAQQWEELANEAIEDAGYWKREAWKAQETSRDLLAALEGLLEDYSETVMMLDEWRTSAGYDAWGEDDSALKARAAIAKATGEE